MQCIRTQHTTRNVHTFTTVRSSEFFSITNERNKHRKWSCWKGGKGKKWPVLIRGAYRRVGSNPEGRPPPILRWAQVGGPEGRRAFAPSLHCVIPVCCQNVSSPTLFPPASNLHRVFCYALVPFETLQNRTKIFWYRLPYGLTLIFLHSPMWN